ncbi:MAG: alcohol dehydrogenase catalytic domain-containing protein, partial [Deltaproteobacteria bacterium]|nr:alcohol dehydrogenase catalytic domain-containing protein [Deltaproteobacteria bacterium]
MKIKAAVLREPKRPIEIEELELAPPKQNEVCVKVAYTGWCHSDQHLYLGEIPIAMPFVIGHEAS